MDSYVWSAVHPAEVPSDGLSPPLRFALDCARRANWMGAHDILQQALQNPADARAAHYLLWEVCQVLGHPEIGIANLHAALRPNPVTSHPSANPRRRVLALATPGDFQANLPLGALFDPADTELHTLWLCDPAAILRSAAPAARLPGFDCVFISIAEDARHRLALQAADHLVAALQAPAINCGRRIAATSRVEAAKLLQDIPHAIIPRQSIATRAELAACETSLNPVRLDFPMIIRPTASHAGRDLARIGSVAELRRYLDRVGDDAFYVAPFIDYRSVDGLWRKYRIIFVDGRPYPYHMAIHSDWAIWYYNARMERDAWKRDEEARFVDEFDRVFPAKALAALHALGERIGLDYFGLDCGLMPDGRLVVFEVETGMIVHDRDSPELFPYRSASVRRIREAAERMIDARLTA